MAGRLHTDASVIAASRQQPERFGQIFERHFADVFAFCARRIGRQDAEDIASEVFRRAFERRHQYDGEHSSAFPWLVTIAGNLLRDRWRADGRRSSAGPLIALSEKLCPAERDIATDAASALDARLHLQVVAQALASFPPAEVETLLLHVWEQLSYAEIAYTLEIPVGTVRSRINRLRHRLDELVDGPGTLRDCRTVSR